MATQQDILNFIRSHQNPKDEDAVMLTQDPNANPLAPYMPRSNYIMQNAEDSIPTTDNNETIDNFLDRMSNPDRSNYVLQNPEDELVSNAKPDYDPLAESNDILDKLSQPDEKTTEATSETTPDSSTNNEEDTEESKATSSTGISSKSYTPSSIDVPSQSGIPPISPLDQDILNNKQAMLSAQHGQNLSNLYVGLGRMGAQISAAMSGVKPDLTAFTEMAKQTGIPVEQLMQLQQSQMEAMKQQKLMTDLKQEQAIQQAGQAGSPMAESFRNMLNQEFQRSKMNISLPPGMSIQQMEALTGIKASTVMGYQQNIESAQAAGALKEKLAQLNRDAMTTRIQGGQTFKQTQADNKKITDVAKALDPSAQRTNTTYGKNDQLLKNADRMITLINQGRAINPKTGKPFGYPEPIVYELSQGVANIVKQGGTSATVQDIKHMFPRTVVGDIQTKLGQVLNTPMDYKSQEFIELFENIIQREHATIGKQQLQDQGNKIASIRHLKDNPQAQEIFKRYFGTTDPYPILDSMNTNPTIGNSPSVGVSTSNDNMVRIQTPNGTVMRIPRNNLQNAIDKGAKVI